MERTTEALVRIFEAVFQDLKIVIGWEGGYDASRATPAFIRDREDLARLVWNPLCAQNLSGFLVKDRRIIPQEDEKRIGVCVKGCDSRSLVALIQEGFLARDRLFIVGIPCEGTVDWRRVMRLWPSHEQLRGVRIEGPELVVETEAGRRVFPLEDVLERRCLRCRYPNPVIHDAILGEPVVPRALGDGAYADVDRLEEGSLEERLAFWKGELGRCIRCYACRNACPLCVCQDRCIAETRSPKWLTQQCELPEKFFFHMIHAFHLAGRCTECGECERVCPMEIPATLLKEKLNQVVKDLLQYEAGVDPLAKPPLLTFDPAETGL
jgi:formate dehydrogenase subunit beta